MEYLDNIGKRAQAAKPDLQHLKSEEKNQILRKSADDLKLHAAEILAANEKDMEKGYYYFYYIHNFHNRFI